MSDIKRLPYLSEDEADAILSALTVKELREVAREHSVTLTATTRGAMRKQLVYWTVGRRADSAAILGRR